MRFALHAGEQVIFFDDGGALNVPPQMTQCLSMGVSFQVVAFSQIDYNIEYVQIQYWNWWNTKLFLREYNINYHVCILGYGYIYIYSWGGGIGYGRAQAAGEPGETGYRKAPRQVVSVPG